MKASANVFPQVLFNVAAAPATPASGNVTIYAKTGGGMFAKDSTGAETALGGGGGGSGTVTSVALSVPGFLSVAGSPITTSGTLAVTLATQTANLVFAGPATGAAAAPTFRALVAADVSFALTNPMTAVGDMIVGGTAGAPTRVGIGTNAYVWTSNGTTASWQAAASGVALSNTSAWTKNQYVALTTLTYASTVTPDASTSNNFALTMTGACTLANPTNLQTGMVLNFCIDQDSTGGRVITFGSAYKWPGGTAPTWITTASAKNFFSAYYDGTILRCNGGAGYA